MQERTPRLWLKCGVFWFCSPIGLEWLTGWPAVCHEGQLSARSGRLKTAPSGQKQTFAISFMGPSIVIVVSGHAELHRLWFFQHKIQFHHVDEASAEFNG